jgi:mono/diheme cytochrome c family protein
MSVALLRNLSLTALLVLLVAAHWAVPSVQTQRNFHFMPDMVDSMAYETQAPPPLIDGEFAVDLRPPAGSVARGHQPLSYDPTPEGAALAGMELENPTLAGATEGGDSAAVERGAFVFSTFCVTCHGPQGLGDGPVTKQGVPPPPSLIAERALRMADGQMYHVITFGQGNMAAYASQVEREDRWRVINYVRRLQQEATAQ